MKRPFRFICVTDNNEGLDEGIEAVPIPDNPNPDKIGDWPDIFLKLAIWKKGFADMEGTVLFLDVDVVIMDDIDCFFDYKPGKNCIIHNWIERRKTIFSPRPNIGNSSIFRFETENSDYVYQTFLKEMDDAYDKSKFTTEQAFLTHAMIDYEWWPEEWVTSFKRSCRPTFPFNYFMIPRKPVTKILVFHGNPDPDEAIHGFKGRKLHHSIRPTPWIAEYWHK